MKTCWENDGQQLIDKETTLKIVPSHRKRDKTGRTKARSDTLEQSLQGRPPSRLKPESQSRAQLTRSRDQTVLRQAFRQFGEVVSSSCCGPLNSGEELTLSQLHYLSCMQLHLECRPSKKSWRCHDMSGWKQY